MNIVSIGKSQDVGSILARFIERHKKDKFDTIIIACMTSNGGFDYSFVSPRIQDIAYLNAFIDSDIKEYIQENVKDE